LTELKDSDRNPNRYHYEFIHNVLGNFMKDLLDYFSTYLYPRFQWTAIGTYDKAVAYLTQNEKYGRETDQAMKPALILNPSGDFDFDETYGKLFWRFPNLAPGMVKRILDPIYQDQNVIINLGYSRLKGEVEFIALVNSFYEYIDVKMYLGLIFGGKDRYIYPTSFDSFIILPKEIYNYQYNNEYTGVAYKLNIPEAQSKLIETTNLTEVVYPLKLTPKFKLIGMSDASERLGGTDRMPTWKLIFNIEYEIEVPSWLILESDYLVQNIKMNIKYGSCFSENTSYNLEEVPVNISIINGEMKYMDSTTGLEIDIDSTSPVDVRVGIPESSVKSERDLEFKTRYFHVVTKPEEESTTTISFDLPEPILDIELIIVNTKNGKLNYGDNYTISNDGLVITINKETVTLTENDILELYVYEDI